MIPVDLSANCEGWIYDPNGSGIKILGIRSRDPFSGSTDMSVRLFATNSHVDNRIKHFPLRALLHSNLQR